MSKGQLQFRLAGAVRVDLMRGFTIVMAVVIAGALTMPVAGADPVSPVVASEFIFEQAPFAQSHAATLAETSDGLVAAWFAGTREKNPDVGIWVARRQAGRWSRPRQVATGAQPDGRRYPCWNPVLFRSRRGELLLFFKVGPDPDRWWGMVATSADDGRSWNEPVALRDGVFGPAKNKPLQLADDDILSPGSVETGGWRIALERSRDGARDWRPENSPPNPERFRAIQPTLLDWGAGRLQLLARSREGRIVESWSGDGGRTWSALHATALPNPNSGIDAVMLRDRRALLVYNPTGLRRSPLTVAISADGRRWHDVLTLESGWGEYSYPAVIQGADGLIHIAYTWKRERIKHVVLDPARLEL